MSEKTQKSQRMLSLALYLSDQSREVRRSRIVEDVEGYQGNDPKNESFAKMLNRDLDSLAELGVFIKRSADNQNQDPAYILDKEKSFCAEIELPPAEAIRLRLLCASVLSDPDFPYADELRSALLRIQGFTGSEGLIPEVRKGASGDKNGADAMKLCNRAVCERRLIKFEYTNRNWENSERTVEPHCLFSIADDWYLFAWCLNVKDFRQFRLDRMEKISFKGKADGEDFQRRDFQLDDHLVLPFQLNGASPILASIIFPPSYKLPLPQRRLTLCSGVFNKLPGAAGMQQLSVPYRDEAALLRWVIEQGKGSTVYSPSELQERFLGKLDALASDAAACSCPEEDWMKPSKQAKRKSAGKRGRPNETSEAFKLFRLFEFFYQEHFFEPDDKGCDRSMSLSELSAKSNIPVDKLPDMLAELSCCSRNEYLYVPLIIEDDCVQAGCRFDGLGAPLRLSYLDLLAMNYAFDCAGLPEDSQLRMLLSKASPKAKLEYLAPQSNALEPADGALAAQIRDAIAQKRLLRLEYRAFNEEQSQERVVEPQSLYLDGGSFYLEAFCQLRQDWRSFKLQRIDSAQILEECFVPRADAEAQEQFGEKLRQSAVKLRLVFDTGVCFEPREWPEFQVIGSSSDGRQCISVPWLGSDWLPLQIISRMGAVKLLDDGSDAASSLLRRVQELASAYSQAAKNSLISLESKNS